MKVKKYFYYITANILSILVIPLLIIKVSTIENINKSGFLILLLVSFAAFSLNIIFTYFKGKDIILPIISSTTSLFLFLFFNKTAIVLIIMIVLFSCLGYFLGTLFSKEK